MTDPYVLEMLAREREQKAADLALIESLFEAEAYWDAAIFALGPGLSEYVPRILWRRWSTGAMSVEQLRTAIPSVWIYNKSPVPPIGERAWLAMYRAAGFLCQVCEVWTSSDDGDRKQNPIAYATDLVEEPPLGPVIVWRGASLESRGRGLSWTQYRECGVNFAQAWANVYRVASGLYRAELPGRAVLAIFGDDREQEIVINPNMLRGRIERVTTVDPEPPDPRLKRIFGLE